MHVVQSEAYKQYERDCLWQIPYNFKLTIDYPVNVKCLFYMQTHRIVDLNGLIQSIDDILVKGGVLQDDNSRIVVAHDGSRVLYDKKNPRVEIYIEVMK
jgi:Holliday junction resolvase RusA-like endonuclease